MRNIPLFILILKAYVKNIFRAIFSFHVGLGDMPFRREIDFLNEGVSAKWRWLNENV